jgi:hypothetical protein
LARKLREKSNPNRDKNISNDLGVGCEDGSQIEIPENEVK